MNHFAYGIADKNNQPYGVTSPDRGALDCEVAIMNSSPNLFNVADRAPFRVVPLYLPPDGKLASAQKPGDENMQSIGFSVIDKDMNLMSCSPGNIKELAIKEADYLDSFDYKNAPHHAVEVMIVKVDREQK